MADRSATERAAVAAAVGLTGMAAFQLLLAAGAPLGDAAWGGTRSGQLPTELRVGSALSLLVYGAAAALLLRCAGFPVPGVSFKVARAGTWVLAGLMILGTVANLASSSPWERLLFAPLTGLVAAACVVVARSKPAGGSSDQASVRAGWSR
jgi:hypothetical protein